VSRNINHLAIIMDGNGRWAEALDKPRAFGHSKGAEVAKTIINKCVIDKIPYLTLYTFSKENWGRPSKEIDALMNLLSKMLEKEIENMLRNNIVFNVVGNIEDLPSSTKNFVYKAIDLTKNNNGMTLTLALSYSGRQEIIDAVKKIIKNDEKIINEEILKNHLYCPEMPDPDLIIRTGGEYRLSNFLLWQSAYSELYISKKNWPDFEEEDIDLAILNFKKRVRKFGSLDK
tara:strand:+ start:541 stop:1230 length:690 start_codon:yes stop_codon:yes gene_type:complete